MQNMEYLPFRVDKMTDKERAILEGYKARVASELVVEETQKKKEEREKKGKERGKLSERHLHSQTPGLGDQFQCQE